MDNSQYIIAMTTEQASNERIKAEQEIASILYNLEVKTGLIIDKTKFIRTDSGHIFMRIKMYL